MREKVGSYVPNVYTKLVNDPYFRDTKTIFDNVSDDYITYNRPSRLPKHKTCQACRTGGFASERDKQMHLGTKKHRQMSEYEAQWSFFLQQEKINH